MKQRYKVELVEEHEAVNFYSICLENKEHSELEDFFGKFPLGCAYDEEVDVIVSWIDKIAERGALERYFRPEGFYGDGVGVIPIDVGNKIRLYCLRLTDQILIFGNGGIKDVARWEDSKRLTSYVRILIDTSRFISFRLKNGTLELRGNKIVGDLNFIRDEKE